MKIEKIEIENFKGIHEKRLTLNGNSVYVIGGNAKGKTTFIDAVFKIISGKDLPPQPLTTGENRGSVKLDLGELVIEYSYNAKGSTSLIVSTPDGAQYKQPRTMLDKLVGVVDFGIDDFLKLSPKKQVEKIKALIGIDWTDVDVEYKKSYDRRTFLNGKISDLEALPTDHRVNGIDFDPDSVQQEISILDVQADIQKANDFNNRRAGFVERLSEKVRRQSLIAIEIKELQAKILLLDEESLENNKKITEGNAWLEANTEISIAEEQSNIESAIEHNKRYARAQEVRKIKLDIKSVEAERELIQAKMDEIDAMKRRNIAEANLPVPGLTFDDNQLYLNGLPFETSQINTAERIKAGLQLSLSMLGDVRIARFDGSLLDNENINYVKEWADSNDLQLFIEFVTRDKEGLRLEVQENG